MKIFSHLGSWFGQGADAAVRAYTRASDAYAADGIVPSVALWTVLIAAMVLLLEWLLSRRGGRARG
jgi:hypothetical protein